MKKLLLLLTVVVLTLSGCARFSPDYEKPTVGLSSFKMLPSPGIIPQFEIGLHIVNPNRRPLPIEGLSYSISIDNHRILNGVARDLPTVAGYSEEEIRLRGTVNIGSSIQLLNRLLAGSNSSLTCLFTAKIDTGRFSPMITVREETDLKTFAGADRSP